MLRAVSLARHLIKESPTVQGPQDTFSVCFVEPWPAIAVGSVVFKLYSTPMNLPYTIITNSYPSLSVHLLRSDYPMNVGTARSDDLV
jgi:hypothetical protein